MKNKTNILFKTLYGFLMTVLGFSSCDSINDIIEPRAEYGQPHAEFKLVGEVKSSEGKPVKGVRVIVKPYVEGTAQEILDWNRDTLFTDAEGKFSKDKLKHTWPSKMKGSTIIFEDVDGPENGGEFEPLTMNDKEFSVEQISEGHGNWYDGVYLVTANAIMSPKKND